MARRSSETHRPTVLGPLLFGAFVIFGSAYIVGSKFASFPAAAVTLVPVAIMIGYAIAVKFARALRLRDDQAGDNLYYMGFLFTLTSLGVSLFQFRADGAAEEIVQNFGVAVGSTIAGIGLRVLFNQMRQDPADVEEASRLELAEAARRVRQELDASVGEIANFRRSAQQQVAEGFEDVRRGMEEVSTRILTTFEEMTTRAAKPFESASQNSSEVLERLAKTIGENLDGAAQRLAAQNEKLASGTETISNALAATSEKLTAMQTPERVIEIKLEPIVASIAKSIDEFGLKTEAKADAERAVLTALSEAATEQRSRSQDMAALVAAISKAADAMTAAAQQSDAQIAQIQRLVAVAEADRQKEAQTSRLLESLSSKIDGLMSAISRWRQPGSPPSEAV